MSKDNLGKLYKSLKAIQGTGFTRTEEEFRNDMKDADKRKRLWSNLPKYDKGFNRTFDEFSSDMGFSTQPDAPAELTQFEKERQEVVGLQSELVKLRKELQQLEGQVSNLNMPESNISITDLDKVREDAKSQSRIYATKKSIEEKQRRLNELQDADHMANIVALNDEDIKHQKALAEFDKNIQNAQKTSPILNPMQRRLQEGRTTEVDTQTPEFIQTQKEQYIKDNNVSPYLYRGEGTIDDIQQNIAERSANTQEGKEHIAYLDKLYEDYKGTEEGKAYQQWYKAMANKWWEELTKGLVAEYRNQATTGSRRKEIEATITAMSQTSGEDFAAYMKTNHADDMNSRIALHNEGFEKYIEGNKELEEKEKARFASVDAYAVRAYADINARFAKEQKSNIGNLSDALDKQLEEELTDFQRRAFVQEYGREPYSKEDWVKARGITSRDAYAGILKYQKERGKIEDGILVQKNNLFYANRYLDDALTMVDNVKSGKGFLSGLGQTATDIDTWDMGLMELSKNMALKDAVDKFNRIVEAEEKGEKPKEQLTPEEQALLDASASYMAVSAYYSNKIGRGYKVGQTTAASIPFMVDFFISRGIIKNTTNAVARGLTNYIGKAMLKKGASTAAKRTAVKVFMNPVSKTLAKTTGTLVAAAEMTAIWGIPKVAADTYDKMTGTTQFKYNEEGTGVEFAGVEDAQGAGEAIYNSIVQNVGEQWSEMLFTGFTPLKGLGFVKAASGAMTKLGNKFTLTRAMRDLWKNPAFADFTGATQWHGILGEFAEEEVNNLINIFARTDTKAYKDNGEIDWGKTFKENGFSLDEQITTFLSLAPTSIFMGGIGGARLAAQNIKIGKSIKEVRNTLTTDVERRAFDSIVNNINKEINDVGARDAIRKVLSSNVLTNEQKKETALAIAESYRQNLSEEVRRNLDELDKEYVSKVVQKMEHKVKGKSTGTIFETTFDGTHVVITGGNLVFRQEQDNEGNTYDMLDMDKSSKHVWVRAKTIDGSIGKEVKIPVELLSNPVTNTTTKSLSEFYQAMQHAATYKEATFEVGGVKYDTETALPIDESVVEIQDEESLENEETEETAESETGTSQESIETVSSEETTPDNIDPIAQAEEAIRNAYPLSGSEISVTLDNTVHELKIEGILDKNNVNPDGSINFAVKQVLSIKEKVDGKWKLVAKKKDGETNPVYTKYANAINEYFKTQVSSARKRLQDERNNQRIAEQEAAQQAAAESAALVEEQRREQVLASITRKKDGSVDLKAMTPEQKFLYMMSKKGVDTAVDMARGEIEDIRKEIADIDANEKMRRSDKEIEKSSLEEEALAWADIINRYTPQQNNEKNLPENLENPKKNSIFAEENQLNTEENGSNTPTESTRTDELDSAGSSEVSESRREQGDNSGNEDELDSGVLSGTNESWNGSIRSNEGMQESDKLLHSNQEKQAVSTASGEQYRKIEEGEISRLNDELYARQESAGILHPKQKARLATAQEFYDAIVAAKQGNPHGWAVDAHEVSDYENYILLLSEDGKAGIAVKPDGDIVSLFSVSEERGMMNLLIPMAVQVGGNKMDCYVTKTANSLANQYSRYGFKVANRIPFAEGHMGKDYLEWKKDHQSEVPQYVAFLYFDGAVNEVVDSYDRSRTVSIEDYPVVEDVEGVDAYTLAGDQRDAMLAEAQKAKAERSEDNKLTTVDSQDVILIRPSNKVNNIYIARRTEETTTDGDVIYETASPTGVVLRYTVKDNEIYSVLKDKKKYKTGSKKTFRLMKKQKVFYNGKPYYMLSDYKIGDMPIPVEGKVTLLPTKATSLSDAISVEGNNRYNIVRQQVGTPIFKRPNVVSESAHISQMRNVKELVTFPLTRIGNNEPITVQTILSYSNDGVFNQEDKPLNEIRKIIEKQIVKLRKKSKEPAYSEEELLERVNTEMTNVKKNLVSIFEGWNKIQRSVDMNLINSREKDKKLSKEEKNLLSDFREALEEYNAFGRDKGEAAIEYKKNTNLIIPNITSDLSKHMEHDGWDEGSNGKSAKEYRMFIERLNMLNAAVKFSELLAEQSAPINRIVPYVEERTTPEQQEQIKKQLQEMQEEYGIEAVIFWDINDMLEHPDPHVRQKSKQIIKDEKDGSHLHPAWINPSDTKKAYFFMPHLLTKREATKAYMHEVIGHIGMRHLLNDKLGGKSYDDVMIDLFKNHMSEEQKDDVRAFAKDNNLPTDNLPLVMDEYIASQVESGKWKKNPRFYKRVWDAIRELLSKLPIIGDYIKFNSNDMMYLIRQSNRYLLRNKGYLDFTAVDTTQQNKRDSRKKIEGIEENSEKMQEGLDKGGTNVLSLQEFMNETIKEYETESRESLFSVLKRFSQAEQRGFASGGKTYAAAQSVLGRDARSMPEDIGQDERNERQELVIEEWAKANGVWYDNAPAQLEEQYGEPLGNGQEAIVFAKDGHTVIKSKNTLQYYDLQSALDAIALHNSLFPETAMTVTGFGKDIVDGEEGFVMVIEQPFVDGERLTQEEIDEFVEKLGFEKENDGFRGHYKNDQTLLHDLHTGNVLRTPEGNIDVIDDIIRFNTPEEGVGGKRTFDNEVPLFPDQIDEVVYRNKLIAKRDIDDILDNPNEPLELKFGRMASFVHTVIDNTEGIRLLQNAIDDFRREKGQSVLNDDYDVRNRCINAQAAIEGKKNVFEQTMQHKVDDLLIALEKLVEGSELYKHYKQDNPIDGERVGAELTPMDFIERYLIAKDNCEREDMNIPTRGKKDFEKRMKIDMRTFVAAFETAYTSFKFDNLWEEIKEVSKFGLQTELDAGLISQDEFEIFNLRQHYIPERDFFGVEQEENDNIQRIRRSNKPIATSKKARGGDSLATNVVANLYLNVYDAIEKAEYNDVKRTMFNLLQENPEFCRAYGILRPRQVYYIQERNVETGVVVTKRVSDSELTEEQKMLATEINARLKEWYETLNEATDAEERMECLEQIKYLKSQLPYVSDRATVGREFASQAERNTSTVGVYVDGKLVEMVFPNMLEVAMALNNKRAINTEDDIYQKVTRGFSSLCTTYNPTFFVVNGIRDSIWAMRKGTAEYGIEFGARLFKNLSVADAKSRNPMRDFVNGKLDLSTPEGKLFAEFIKNGGATGFVSSKDSYAISKELEEYAANINKAGIRKGLASMGKFAKKMNELTELWTRFAVYKTVKELGYSDMEATKAAKNMSVNFNMRGHGGNKLINAFMKYSMFGNAAIQGAASFYRTFSISKRTKANGEVEESSWMKQSAKAVTRLVLLPALGGFLNAMWLAPDDDEDGVRIPDWERERYMYIGSFIRIPLPEQIIPMWNIGVQLALLCQGRKTFTEAGLSIINAFVKYLLPLPPMATNSLMESINVLAGKEGSDWGDVIRNAIIPQAAKSIMDFSNDSNFVGNSLRSEYAETKRLPQFEQQQHEAELYKDISYGFYLMTGGDKKVTGLAHKNDPSVDIRGDFSPKQVKAALSLPIPSGYLDAAQLLYGLGKSVATGRSVTQTLRWKDVPIINRFYNPQDRSSYNYAITNEASKIVKRYNTDKANYKSKAKAGNEYAQGKIEALPDYENLERALNAAKAQSVWRAATKAQMTEEAYRAKYPKESAEMDKKEDAAIQTLQYHLYSFKGFDKLAEQINEESRRISDVRSSVDRKLGRRQRPTRPSRR